MEIKYERERAECLRQLYKLHPWTKRILDFRKRLSLYDTQLVDNIEKYYAYRSIFPDILVPRNTRQVFQKYWERLHQLQAEEYRDSNLILRLKLFYPPPDSDYFKILFPILTYAEEIGYTIQVMVFDVEKFKKYPQQIQKYVVTFDERYKKVLSREAIKINDSEIRAAIRKLLRRLVNDGNLLASTKPSQNDFMKYQRTFYKYPPFYLQKVKQQMKQQMTQQMKQLILGESIGRGRNGQVFKATTKSGKVVAVKVPGRKDESLKQQFENMNTVYEIIPEYVPIPYYYGKMDGKQSIVMQYLECPPWMTFYDYMTQHYDKNKPTPITRKMEKNLKSAVQKLKQRKIRHEDLHLTNILVNPQDGSVKIIDWGSMSNSKQRPVRQARFAVDKQDFTMDDLKRRLL